MQAFVRRYRVDMGAIVSFGNSLRDLARDPLSEEIELSWH